MKKVYVLSIALLALSAQGVMAQDNNDTDTDSHTLDIVIPEIAILDIEGLTSPTGDESNAIVFDLGTEIANATTEAGLGFETVDLQNNDLWLNYTSIVSAVGNSRQIDVHVDDLANVPSGFIIELTTPTQNIQNGGDATLTAGTQWTSANGPLSASPFALASGIQSAYTGQGANQGVNLQYNLVQDGTDSNFSDLVSGTYQAVFTYTLSDDN